MRKISTLAFSILLLAGGTGCIIVASDHHCRSCKWHGEKRVIEIDGDPYVIDLEKHSIEKLDVSVTTESGK